MRFGNLECSSCVLLGILIFAPGLYATLGEEWHAPSIKKTDKSGSLNTQTFPQFAVHERVDLDGSKTREYTNNNNIVFAVAWEGRRHPELTEILGSHYPTFHLLVDKVGRQRKPVFIESGTLRVLIGGHQRDFRGQAILSHLKPESVKVEELR
jgi:hypothetical protein